MGWPRGATLDHGRAGWCHRESVGFLFLSVRARSDGETFDTDRLCTYWHVQELLVVC